MAKEALGQVWLGEGTESLRGTPDQSRTRAGGFLNPLADPEWDTKLERLGNHSFFATEAWARVLHESYGFEPKYFLSRAGDAMLPVMEISSRLTGCRGVSLPFSDECEPVAADKAAFREVFEQAIAHGRGRSWRYLELRGGQTFFAGLPVYLRFYTHELGLAEDTQVMFSKLDSSVRRAIRKAEKQGIAVELRTDLEALKDFYQLQCRTRRKHGLPPQPYRFFQSVQANILGRGKGVIALARQGARAIAGAVFFRDGTQALYKFGASDERFQQLRGNDLVMWSGLKHFALQGCRSLHLGRTSLANEGLRRFKLGWGAHEGVLEYFRFDLRRNEFVTGRDEAFGWYNRIFAMMPMGLARLAGGLMYRHVA